MIRLYIDAQEVPIHDAPASWESGKSIWTEVP
jgi:hypothetical protein